MQNWTKKINSGYPTTWVFYPNLTIFGPPEPNFSRSGTRLYPNTIFFLILYSSDSWGMVCVYEKSHYLSKGLENFFYFIWLAHFWRLISPLCNGTTTRIVRDLPGYLKYPRFTTIFLNWHWLLFKKLAICATYSALPNWRSDQITVLVFKFIENTKQLVPTYIGNPGL